MVSTNKGASIIVKSKFVLPTNESFQKYIDYVDRDEAKRNSAYENYSAYSEGYSKRKIKVKELDIEKKEVHIKTLQEKLKGEVKKLENLKGKYNKYSQSDNYLNEFDSLKFLFSKENSLFNWNEKKELRKAFNGLTPDFNNYATEEKAIELFSSKVEMIVQSKRSKIEIFIDKKENYIKNLENKIDYELKKIDKIKEQLFNYNKYMDYMDNPEKTSSLFNDWSNKLSENEKKHLKEKFELAHKNGSIMWQDVISFDNKWLEENGLYDAVTHQLDEDKIKNITRLSMQEMLKREGMNNTATWSAAIHYNTDNIHIHIATVETIPTRDRGKRKYKSIELMKSKFVNNIMDRSQEQKYINELIRNRLLDSKKKDSLLAFKNRTFKKDFLDIYKSLPVDRKQWSYGYNSIVHLRPKIDKITTEYIEKYHKKDFQELIEKLDKEVKVFNKTYGEGDANRFKDYKKNKIDELYKRMGNAILQEMRNYDKENKSKLKPSIKSKRENFKDNLAFKQVKFGIDRMLNSEYKNWKNQIAYEKLQREIEMER